MMPAFMAYLVASCALFTLQFPEDILPVAVYRMEAEVSFGSYFFGCFPQGYLF